MKKTLCILLIISTMLSFCACSKKKKNDNTVPAEPEEPYVVKLINELPEPSYVSIDPHNTVYKIKKIEERYNALSEEEKAMVSNYSEFLEKKRGWDFYLYEYYAEEQVELSIRTTLLNPSSLQINSMTVCLYYASDCKTLLMAYATCNYSAQNRMGGYNRETVHMGLLFDDSEWTYDCFSWDDFSTDISTIMAKVRELNAVHITDPNDLKP